MKTIGLLSFILVTAVSVQAQAQTPSAIKPAVVQNLPPKVATIATVNSIEGSMVIGFFNLNRIQKAAAEGKDFVTTYSITNNEAGFATRKPIAVTLDKGSFDAFVSNSSGLTPEKQTRLNRYIEDKKLSLSDEKSWIAAMNYVNSIR